MQRLIANIAVILCLTYFINQWAFVFPFLEYYANYEYIVTVLCINQDKPELECNGKCHLKKSLKEQTNEEQSKSAKSFPSQKQEYSPHLITTGNCCTRIFIRRVFFVVNKIFFSSQHSELITPPEKRFS